MWLWWYVSLSTARRTQLTVSKVRHSLTSDEVFSDTCSGFNYVEFYDQIREFLESPRFEQISAALIEWWNE